MRLIALLLILTTSACSTTEYVTLECPDTPTFMGLTEGELRALKEQERTGGPLRHVRTKFGVNIIRSVEYIQGCEANEES